MPKRDPKTPDLFDPRPESAMGGASDAGASGGHPAGSPELRREGRSPRPDEVPGVVAYERRHHRDTEYAGPWRRALDKESGHHG